MTRVTSTKVVNLEARVVAALEAARVKAEKSRGPVTDDDRAQGVFSCAQRVEAAGGRPAALLGRAGAMINTKRGAEALSIIIALGDALGNASLLDHIERCIEGTLPLRPTYTANDKCETTQAPSLHAIGYPFISARVGLRS